MPDETPRHNPILTTRCHFSKLNAVVSKPSTLKETEIITTLGMPSRNIIAPPNGAIDAKITYMTAIDVVTSEIFHPKDSVSGITKT
jgi:hypothetical protein